MPNPPTPSPVELVATLVRLLCAALQGRSSGGRLIAGPLLSLIQGRLIRFALRFRRYVERVQAGRPFPRRRPADTSTPESAEKPRRPAPPADPLPRHFNWLEQFLPDLAPHRGMLANLLGQPETVALIEAAPEPMGRLFRPLCRMLGLPPPALLVRPRKPRQPRAKPVPARRPRRRWRYNAAVQGPLPPRRSAAPPPPPPPPPSPPPPLPPPRAAPAPPRPGGLALDWSTGRPRLVWT